MSIGRKFKNERLCFSRIHFELFIFLLHFEAYFNKGRIQIGRAYVPDLDHINILLTYIQGLIKSVSIYE